jgi:hypothetical protein
MRTIIAATLIGLGLGYAPYVNAATLDPSSTPIDVTETSGAQLETFTFTLSAPTATYLYVPIVDLDPELSLANNKHVQVSALDLVSDSCSTNTSSNGNTCSIEYSVEVPAESNPKKTIKGTNEISLELDYFRNGKTEFVISTDRVERIKVTDLAPDINVNSAPLPATWGMMLIGLVGLGFAAYQHSRRRTALAVA